MRTAGAGSRSSGDMGPASWAAGRPAATPRRPPPSLRQWPPRSSSGSASDADIIGTARSSWTSRPDSARSHFPGLESLLPPIPASFKCPITHDVMRDPVVTQDGHVYEREAIQEWFRRGHRSSPVTGMMLPNLALLPEVPLRRAIEEYMCLRPDIARKEFNLRSALTSAQEVVKDLEEELHSQKLLLAGVLKVQRNQADLQVRATRGAGPGAEMTRSDSAQNLRQDHFGPHHSCSELPMPRLGRSRDSTPSSDVEDNDDDRGRNSGRASGGLSSQRHSAPAVSMMAIPTPCRARASAPRKWKSPVRSECIRESVFPDTNLGENSSTSATDAAGQQRATKLQELMKAVRANFRGKSARRQRHSTGSMADMHGVAIDDIQ